MLLNDVFTHFTYFCKYQFDFFMETDREQIIRQTKQECRKLFKNGHIHNNYDVFWDPQCYTYMMIRFSIVQEPPTRSNIFVKDFDQLENLDIAEKLDHVKAYDRAMRGI